MNKSRFWRPLAVLASASAMLCGASTSAHAFWSPVIHMTNGVEYMDGGKSVAEVKFLQMVAPRWAAVLQFAVNKGPQNAFPADVKVSVHDKHTGRPVMETTASGPVMLVRLDEGTYGVQATVGDLTLTQSLTVSEGASAKALFLWPSNFDFAAVSASENQRQAAKKAVLS